MKSAFDKIAAGLEDAIGYAEGDRARARETTVDVRAIREANHMTQAAFAETFRLKLAALVVREPPLSGCYRWKADTR
jgi:putative transcriptional regulator